VEDIAAMLDLKRDRVIDALKRRAYLGLVQNNQGEWIRGKHEPIVDARTFQEAQDALRSRTRGSRGPKEGAETSTWWLRDVATCFHCGAKMSAGYAGPKEKRRYYFYCSKRCQNPNGKQGRTNGTFTPVRDVEAQAEPLVLARLEELRHDLAGPGSNVVKLAPRQDLKERRAKLDAKRAKYLEMHADGITTRDELRVQLEKIDAERMKIDALATERPGPSPEEKRAALGQLTALAKAWKNLPPPDRRTVVNNLALQVRVAAGKRPRATWRSVEDLVARGR
jgi:hypothetical protein